MRLDKMGDSIGLKTNCRTFDKGRKKECLGRGLVQRVPYEDRQYKCRKVRFSLGSFEMCGQLFTTCHNPFPLIPTLPLSFFISSSISPRTVRRY